MFTTQFGQKTLAQYSAPPWCRNPHLQTIWPRFFGRRQLVETQLERLETPDGDFLDLAWGPAPEYVEAVIILSTQCSQEEKTDCGPRCTEKISSLRFCTMPSLSGIPD